MNKSKYILENFVLPIDELEGKVILPAIQNRLDRDHRYKIIRDAGIQNDDEYEQKDIKTAKQFRVIKKIIFDRLEDAKKPNSKWKAWVDRYQDYVTKHGAPKVPK